jgi:ribonuclease E
MAMKMLIEAAHPEETRVVVVKGQQLEEFDFEATNRAQLKGNIYLAKVTRVEPSLQAAFVDYGGNRHGFLAFNEIHPDYYQIPVADRRALLEAEAARQAEEEAEEEAEAEAEAKAEAEADAESASGQIATDESDVEAQEGGDGVEEVAAAPKPEDMGGDEMDDVRPTRRHEQMLRSYKIQEVIKRRQILLVQVVKEERGNKGAALTTYISLAGRYCVLMPNTARGGGISRKITNASDRKRLKTIVGEIEIPDGMALIVRTAGAQRSKAEIKRDYEYLSRTWSEIRDTTLQSIAPALIHEEANLIKRSIRDLYTKDVDEVLVEGDEAYKSAKKFMRMLMPSHAKRVQPYKENVPLFRKYNVDAQLDSMMSTRVTLKSGGYIIINATEALVAIDVNSGRSTRERNIEETALKTNLEAAQEVARQLRLRDLAGLIVIDFIDMEENRNNRSVERKLKECLKSDRARIQVGRISHFGLLEMSRQRLRPSLLESSSDPCPTCGGSGIVFSVETAAMRALRALEDEALRGRTTEASIFVPTPVALYLLNQKRSSITSIESRYGITILVRADDSLIAPDYRIERSGERRSPPAEQAMPVEAEADEEEEEEAEAEAESDTEEEDVEAASGEEDTDGDQPRKRRRRGRRGGRRRRRDGEGSEERSADDSQSETTSAEVASDDVAGDEDEEATGEPKEKRGRRRRRGGRGRRGRGDRDASGTQPDRDEGSEDAATETTETVAQAAGAEEHVDTQASAEPVTAPEVLPQHDETGAPEVGGFETTDVESESHPLEATAEEARQATPPSEVNDRPKKKGWWSRALS